MTNREPFEAMALRVANSMWNYNGIYAGHPISQMQEFARRIRDELCKGQEPVATTCAAFEQNEIGYMKALAPLPFKTTLYLHPAPVPADMVNPYDGRCWQEGVAGNCNIVSFNGEDTSGVMYVENATMRAQVIAKHNDVVGAMIAAYEKEQG